MNHEFLRIWAYISFFLIIQFLGVDVGMATYVLILTQQLINFTLFFTVV